MAVTGMDAHLEALVRRDAPAAPKVGGALRSGMSPVGLALAFIATGAYLALFLRTSWRIGDEGSIVYGAQRVAEGALPYRDFFEVMGPGAFYWLALWFELGGVSWATSRAAVWSVALASAAALYCITARRYRGSFAAFPAALYTLLTVPLWPGANHHFDSNMWVLLAVATFATAREVRVGRAAAAGVLAGITSTIMPQKGLLVCAALALSLLLSGRKDQSRRDTLRAMVGLAVGFAAVGVVVIVWFALGGALADLWYATVLWPATQYHSVNLVPYGFGLREWYLPLWRGILANLFPPLLAHLMVGAIIVPFVLVALAPLAGVLALLRRTIPGCSAGANLPWVYILSGIALFVSEGHRLDMMHLIYGSPMLLVTVTLFLADGRSRSLVFSRRALGVCAAVLAILLATIANASRTPIQTRRGLVYGFADDSALKFLQRHVPAGEEVFVYPYRPMYYFLADVSNPTRYSILMYRINTLRQFREVIETLESRQVRYVLVDTVVAGHNLTRWFPNYDHPREDEQLLENYLEDKYTSLGSENGFKILRRRDVASSEDAAAASREKTLADHENGHLPFSSRVAKAERSWP